MIKIRHFGNWAKENLKVGDKIVFYTEDEFIANGGDGDILLGTESVPMSYCMYICKPDIMNSGKEYTISKIYNRPYNVSFELEQDKYGYNYSPDCIKILNGRLLDEAD